MEKNLVLFHRDIEYTEKFLNYFSGRRRLPFRVYTFSQREALEDFARLKKINLLLIDEGEQSTLEGRVEAEQKILLSAEDSRRAGQQTIYKYQSGERIMSELLHCYQGSFSETASIAKAAQLYMVFSAVDADLKLYFSHMLAEGLAQNRELLYLNMEAYVDTDGLTEGGRTLSEAFYLYKRGALDADSLESCCVRREGMRLLPPVREPEDYLLLGGDELRSFILHLQGISACDAILLDMDERLQLARPLFEYCQRIFVPVTLRKSCRMRGMEQYIQRLPQRIRQRFVRLELPEPGAGERYAASAEGAAQLRQRCAQWIGSYCCGEGDIWRSDACQN